MDIRLVKTIRRSAVLRSPSMGCFRGIPTINVTSGCLHGCVYCYARGFRNAPPHDEVRLYQNLVEMVKRELRSRRSLPAWVSFSSASDPFQARDEVLHMSYSLMDLLLSRGIGVSFLSKGVPPDPFTDLFSRYQGLVRARVGLTSIDEGYCKSFEPRAALPQDRLSFLVKLQAAGIASAVRMDPLIHGVNDTPLSVENTMRALAATGVMEVSISYLYLRPSIIKQLVTEIRPDLGSAIRHHYRSQPVQRVLTSETTRLLPAAARACLYTRIKKVASTHGLRASVCGCKNPDLPFQDCHPVSPSASERLPLFSNPPEPDLTPRRLPPGATNPAF